MRIYKNEVYFDSGDQKFIKKLGIVNAAQFALDFYLKNGFVYISDTTQLADLLGSSIRTIWYMVKNNNKIYKTKVIEKQNGSSRVLHVPKSELDATQKMILKKILNNMPTSEYATAYIKDKKLVDNAKPHVNKKYLLKMDITDFFGSITFEKVYTRVFNKTYFPKQIGFILTSLCCRKDVLPQGASTSPALSNLVMKNFDTSVGDWCKRHDIAYTRYCDDLTFSSNKPLYHVYEKVKEMLERDGFEINENKTHFITNGTRQSVTGLTVNQKVGVSKEYKRKLRQEVYYTLKYGLAESIMNSNDTNFIKNNTPDIHSYYHNLVGRVAFVLQIEPNNIWFKSAFKELNTGEILFEIW